jgi:hypothetical protein
MPSSARPNQQARSATAQDAKSAVSEMRGSTVINRVPDPHDVANGSVQAHFSADDAGDESTVSGRIVE